MRGNFFILFLDFFVLFLSISCTDNNTKGQQWTKEDISKFLDSVSVKDLIATYQESDGYTLIIKNDTTSKWARKVTYILGFPTIVDSLIQTGFHQFKSKQFQTTYIVNDSEVVVTFHQKIIHPSSNWQGQTPWQETIISNYPRLDLKLK